MINKKIYNKILSTNIILYLLLSTLKINIQNNKRACHINNIEQYNYNILFLKGNIGRVIIQFKSIVMNKKGIFI